MFIDDRELYMRVLDDLSRLISGNQEWDAYHNLRRVVEARLMESFSVYVGSDGRHHYYPTK